MDEDLNTAIKDLTLQVRLLLNILEELPDSIADQLEAMLRELKREEEEERL